MKYLFIIFISTLMCETVFDSWVIGNINVLNSSPIKIEAEILVQNEFSNQISNVEINFRDKSNFWMNLKNKQIYYSENWTKIFDEKSNQLIIDVPDKNLLNNISSLISNHQVLFQSDCILGNEIKCSVKYPEYGIYFDAFFSNTDSSLIKITHNYQMTITVVKNIKVNKLPNTEEDDYWNPSFENSFIIDPSP